MSSVLCFVFSSGYLFKTKVVFGLLMFDLQGNNRNEEEGETIAIWGMVLDMHATPSIPSSSITIAPAKVRMNN